MPWRYAAVRTALAALTALAACGDNLAAIPFEDLDAARLAVECERNVRCGLFTDDATCLAYFRARPDRDLAVAIGSGKVRYNPLAAAQCLAARAARGCDLTAREVRLEPEPCTRIFVGTLTVDAACAFDAECGSGACDAPACPRNMCCLGTCASSIATTECTRNAECTDGFCDAGGACQPLASVGAACAADAHCAEGLACIGATELQDGACRLMPHLGEPCPYQRCADLGAVCASGTCVAVGLPGDACTTSAGCSPFARCDGQTQRCANVPTLGLPCEAFCAGEAWCDVSEQVCTAPKPDGQPCSASDQCASLYCEEGPFFDQCTTPLVCT